VDDSPLTEPEVCPLIVEDCEDRPVMELVLDPVPDPVLEPVVEEDG